MEFIILLSPIFEIWELRKRQRKAREQPGHAKSSKYSLEALEKALLDDIERLEEFAATKDFTRENITFLRRVGSWKKKWRSPEVNPRNGEMPPPVLKALYNAAEEIFQTLIQRETSEFPLNLDDDIYLTLDQVFGGDSNHGLRGNPSTDCFNTFPETMIAPFADDFTANARRLPNRKGFREIREKDSEAKAGAVTAEAYLDHSSSQLPWIPEDLEKVFDGAEVAVKQMVLTNTWLRYVDSLPAAKRLFIGVTPQISPPISWRWGKYFWKKGLGVSTAMR